MTTPEQPAAVTDVAGTPIEPGDHVVGLGDPTRALPVTADADGALHVIDGRELYPLVRPSTVRVVTVRDARGRRLAEGDQVRILGGDQAAPPYTVHRVEHAAGLVVLANQARETAPTVPALLVRLGGAVGEGDQVVDDAGQLAVVMSVTGDTAVIEPLMGGPRRPVERATLRRLVERPGAVQVHPDGSFEVPGLSGGHPGLADDVAAILAGRTPNLAQVVPFPRAAGV